MFSLHKIGTRLGCMRMPPSIWAAVMPFATCLFFAATLSVATLSVVAANTFSGSGSSLINPDSKSDEAVCKFAAALPAWRAEVLRRQLKCAEDGSLISSPPSTPAQATLEAEASAPPKKNLEIAGPSAPSTASDEKKETAPAAEPEIRVSENMGDEAKDDDTTLTSLASNLDDSPLCRMAKDKSGEWRQSAAFSAFVDEALRRGISCGNKIGATESTEVNSIAAKPDDSGPSPVAIDENVVTSNQNSDRSDQPMDIDSEDKAVQTAAGTGAQPDKGDDIRVVASIPEISILSANSVGPQGTIKGRVIDIAGLAELRVDGRLVPFDSEGGFAVQTYVPDGGITILVEAVNRLGTTNSRDVRLDRMLEPAATAITFDRLNPLTRKAISNEDALALIIGVETYTETPVNAAYANSDARVFADYAVQKLGIPENRIRTLVDDSADEKGILLSVQDWLHRASRPGKSDIYIFFAGHGLASEDGEDMYLLPHDGSPRLLDRTALLRKELFQDISKANPRSVTAFLDTCYSGTTRGTGTLIASRPIAIRAREQAIPEGFTVMTAAGGDQTAKPLEEVRHGMFSYFLMKGMEGDADANRDNQITAGELHAYVQRNVIQQSSGSQTPELQGDADRVLVRFQ